MLVFMFGKSILAALENFVGKEQKEEQGGHSEDYSFILR